MRGQIKEVLSGLSKATVIVTHDQLEALTMADRIAIMRDGVIEQIGTPHEVFAKPANVFVASFIGTPQMNLVEGEVRRLRATARPTIELGGDEIRARGRSRRVAARSRPRSPIGIRPRAFAPVGARRRHHRGHGRTDRADGRGDAGPCAHAGRAATCASSCRATGASRSARRCICAPIRARRISSARTEGRCRA